MNKKKVEDTNKFSRRNWSFFQKEIENKELLKDVLRFHNKTINRFGDEELINIENNSSVMTWAGMVAFQDILPENYDEIIELNTKKDKNYKSGLVFQNKQIPLDTLGQILQNSFGRKGEFSSKRYPSAGALYPVIPLLIILDSSRVNSNLLEGCYVFDSTNSKLLRICTWNKYELDEIKKMVNYDIDTHPPHCLAYATDFRRATIKYAEKGYRHAMFEVGFMAQCLRESVYEYNTIGERCWSYFIDIALTHKCGLDYNLCPIVLIQWIGYNKD